MGCNSQRALGRAGFIIGMADGEIEGDVLDDVPACEKPSLGNVVRDENWGERD